MWHERSKTPGKFYEDFEIGEEFLTPRDLKPAKMEIQKVDSFGWITGDDNPLHTDPDFCLKTRFKYEVAHGLLTLSFVPGIIDKSGLWRYTCLALTEVNNVRFLKPVFPGDTLSLKMTVLSKLDMYFDEAKKETKYYHDSGEVHFWFGIKNQRKVEVVKGNLVAIFAKRSYFEPKPKLLPNQKKIEEIMSGLVQPQGEPGA